MEQVTIAQAVGRKITKPDGGWLLLEHYDPFDKMFRGNGYDAKYHDPIAGFMSVEDLKKYGFELVPSAEEQEMIDRLRTTSKVAKLSTELAAAIQEWLEKPQTR